MKRFITVMCVVLLSVSVVFAQEITHKVKKHETIASIAKTYGVSTDDLLNANPTLKSRMYVGMVLNIPVAKTAEVSQPKKSAESEIKQKERQQTVTQKSEPKIVQSEIREDKIKVKDENNAVDENEVETADFEKWGFVDEVGYGFLKADGAFAFKFTVGVSYSFTNYFYAQAQIGYNSSSLVDSYKKDNSYIKIEQDMHFITVPLELGYRLTTKNRLWGVVPFAGLGFNIGLSGKTKVDDNKTNLKIGGKLGVEGRVGLRVVISSFQITGSYHYPMNTKQESFFGEDAYPEISIGFGF